MKKLNRIQKETILLSGLLLIMSAKIFLIAHLIHRWKLNAIAEGRPFGDAEDESHRN